MLIEKLKNSLFKKSIKEQPSFSKQLYCLGTIINLTAYGKYAELSINEAEKRLNNIDDKMSAFKNYSELSKINNSAGKKFEVVSPDTYFVIKKAAYYSKLSEGTFDPTIRPLVKLWNIGKDNFKIPTNYEIKEAIKLVNYEDILFNDENRSIMLRKTNQCLDVGGIAKGYAADEIKAIFKKYGVKSALIDLGGNIYAVGKKVNNQNWNIAVQNPLNERGQFVGILNLYDKSVVTSGGYERYSLKNNKVFHHIINPKTGYPAENEIISTTIISNNSIDGDGLSTGVYILGLKKGFKLIEETAGIDAVFITKDKKICITSGIKNNFKLTDTNFNLQEDL